MVLPSELAVPVGTALHELNTNALRHGSLADPNGRLQVTWRVEDRPAGNALRWDWAEHDGPPAAHPTRKSFGHRLLNKVLATQTGAEVDVAFAPDGLRGLRADAAAGTGRLIARPMPALCGFRRRGNDEVQARHRRPRSSSTSKVPAGAERDFGRVIFNDDAVLQGLSEARHLRAAATWGVLTIDTGLGNARFTTWPK